MDNDNSFQKPGTKSARHLQNALNAVESHKTVIIHINSISGLLSQMNEVLDALIEKFMGDIEFMVSQRIIHNQTVYQQAAALSVIIVMLRRTAGGMNGAIQTQLYDMAGQLQTMISRIA